MKCSMGKKRRAHEAMNEAWMSSRTLADIHHRLFFKTEDSLSVEVVSLVSSLDLKDS